MAASTLERRDLKFLFPKLPSEFFQVDNYVHHQSKSLSLSLFSSSCHPHLTVPPASLLFSSLILLSLFIFFLLTQIDNTAIPINLSLLDFRFRDRTVMTMMTPPPLDVNVTLFFFLSLSSFIFISFDCFELFLVIFSIN